MKKIGFLCLVMSITAGCSNITEQESSWHMGINRSKPVLCAPLTDEHELTLSTSEEMLTDRRLHAALANLERLPHSIPEARLGKAKILRILGRTESHNLYESLLDTCLEADGQQGLGQLLISQKRYEEGLPLLRRAVYLEPTNDYMRNDLGVAYLNLFQLREAQFEFTTAIELNDQNVRAVDNLLTLLLVQQREQAARTFVERRQITVKQLALANQRAQELLARKARLEAEENKHRGVSANNIGRQPQTANTQSNKTTSSSVTVSQGVPENMTALTSTLYTDSTGPSQSTVWQSNSSTNQATHSNVEN